MAPTLGLAGDTMLGRMVAERLREAPPDRLFSPELVEVAHEADLFVLNLECCISERGSPWPDPRKPFFFRAPPVAVEALTLLGVDCVTLANNHALDFGEEALEDTLGYLDQAGIAHVGAGSDLVAARAPAVVANGGFRLGVVGFTDHPEEFAARPDRPGVAFADLRRGVPPWVGQTVSGVAAPAVLVTPHWGPNMRAEPVGPVRAAGPILLEGGAALVAGHSAHVFQGVAPRIIFDLGDFLDDYAVDPVLRNDLGLLWLVEFEDARPVRVEAVPLRLEYCFTLLADGDEAAWIRGRFRQLCADMGTEVLEEGGRLVVDWGS